MSFKIMKIKINDQQPLDAIIGELERLGYKANYVSENPEVVSTSDGRYYASQMLFEDEMYSLNGYVETTLDELKKMNNPDKTLLEETRGKTIPQLIEMLKEKQGVISDLRAEKQNLIHETHGHIHHYNLLSNTLGDRDERIELLETTLKDMLDDLNLGDCECCWQVKLKAEKALEPVADAVEQPKPEVIHTAFKNMKILISDNQPLDAVVAELERLGYKKIFGGDGHGCKTIESYKDGTFDAWVAHETHNTTLDELKNMVCVAMMDAKKFIDVHGIDKANDVLKDAPKGAELFHTNTYLRNAHSEGKKDHFARWSEGFRGWVDASADRSYIDEAVSLDDLRTHIESMKDKQ